MQVVAAYCSENSDGAHSVQPDAALLSLYIPADQTQPSQSRPARRSGSTTDLAHSVGMPSPVHPRGSALERSPGCIPCSRRSMDRLCLALYLPMQRLHPSTATQRADCRENACRMRACALTEEQRQPRQRMDYTRQQLVQEPSHEILAACRSCQWGREPRPKQDWMRLRSQDHAV